MIPEQPVAIVHWHHHDIESHARSYNEGYDAAVTQGLADDPSLADDWFAGKIREARASALEDAAQDFEDNMGIGEFDEWARRDGRRWNHIEESWEHQGPYMDWLRARAVTERGGE